jgi:hypothetical protein
MSIDESGMPMRVYPALERDQQLIAFEIDNVYFTVAGLREILRGVSDVSNVKSRALFSSPAELIISFDYKNHPMIVWEPYGDSSRYWIGPEDSNKESVDISALAGAISRYRPSWLLRVLGDICSPSFGRKLR